VKKLNILLLSLFAISLIAAPAHAMTAEELIAKAINALGGEEALRALETEVVTGKVMVQGMELPFKMTKMRPDLLRTESEFQGVSIVQAYDGEKAWTVNPMMGTQDPQDMPPMQEKAFLQQADFDGPLIDYEKKGYTVEYIGEDEVEGTTVHHLKVDTHDDVVYDMYFDAEYFMLLKQSGTMAMEEQEVSMDTYFSDYKQVGELMLPHAIEMRMGEQTMNQIMIETFEHDAEVESAIFERPAVEETEEEASGR
jgi:hypothetical protein